MNKFPHFRPVFFFVCIPLLLCGCEEDQYTVDFYKMDVDPSVTHEIQTIELSEMQGERSAAEPNQVRYGRELELTLEQCRAQAIENNLNLKVQLIAPTIAREQVNAERAKFEWAFTSNIRYDNTDTPTSTTLEGSKVENNNFDFGLDVPLQTGGLLEFNVNDNRNQTNNIFSTLNPAFTTDFVVSFSQPLLRGAGTRANTHSIRVAEYEKQIVDAQTKLEIIRVIAAVDRVYWRLYAARRELDVRIQELDLAQAQLERAKRFVDAGERPQIEVLRAEAGVAQRREAIIIAENNLRDRERELKRVIQMAGLGMESPTHLVPTTEPEPMHYVLDGSRISAFAVDNRMEMLELEFRIAQDVSTIDYLRNQALPLASMNYSYNINGLGANRSDAYDLLLDNQFVDHRLGLNVMIPLGNEQAKSRLRGAYYQRIQRLATKTYRKSLIEFESLSAVDQLEANWQRILASRQSVMVEARLYEAELRQFEIGLNTSTDVLQAQTSLANAQSAEILALAEYQIAQVDLAFATGTLLGAANIEWNPLKPEH